MCSKIKRAADSENVRGIYSCIKAVTGPTSIRTAQLISKTGDVITDQEKQLERWLKW